ncbi:hypothetical protein KEJ47_09630 [Candidatus Bathyarchaeota archaeon]|nr:hypothetical protein [Candidatus Bathyarchaeota archaeon]
MRLALVALNPQESIIMVDDSVYHNTKGKLYLTNRRLFFDYEKRGIFFKGSYTPVTIPLSKISDVSIVGMGPFKKLSINTTREPGFFGIPRFEFSVKNPEVWKSKIEMANLLPLDSPNKEVIIKEVVKARCPYCGMLTELNLGKCPNCGGLLIK